MKKHLLLIFYSAFLAVHAVAQTGGPGQPEFMQFKQVSASDLVNTSTGTFSYNIPLFTIGGYPLNLSYQSGPQMEDVASYVGLGWNLNIGAITRNIRGLPDDFKGDPVTRTIYMKPNITMGGNFNLDLEIVGFPVGANAGMGLFYNNYNGFGLERSYGITLSASNANKTRGASLGLGMKANSQSGVDLYAQPSVFLSSSKSNSMSATGSLGGVISVNSREGLKGSVNASMSLSSNINYQPAQMVEKNGEMTKEKKGDEKLMSENFASFSAAYSFSKSAEIPRVTYPYTTTSYTGSIKVGGEIDFLHPNATLSGYYTRQQLSTNVINTPAYGFLYSDNSAQAGGNVLLDFNREKDQPYVKDVSKNIGIPFYTNDIYSVNAQGISGSFQLNRNDIGVIADNRVASSSSSLNIGLEAGIGNAFHVGADVSSTSNSSSSGKWTTGTTGNIDFKQAVTGNLYQPAYFKNASDVNVDENNFYDMLNRDNAVKVGLHKTGVTSVDMDGRLFDSSGSQLPLPSLQSTPLYKQARDPRTIDIQYLTADQASKFGLDKVIDQYTVNQFDCKAGNYKTSVNRSGDFRQGHHISQVTATNIDGMRYVFGLPTYNISQEEVSYTLTGNEAVDANGLVNYAANTAWGTNGKDGFYEKTATPAYVTANLLTAVLSPDYIDVDDNGPSINDVGNYVKFNYINAGVYTWRTPFQNDKATFNKAFLSDPTDNKASYVEGTKEVWFIHSIESKTEVAEFYYDTARKDARDINNKALYRLTMIKVFNKNERVLNGTNAVPIRVIQLTQDYELCPGTENSLAPSRGKLTLKQLGMYSGKSTRELQSPYVFTYGAMPSGTVVNPAYNRRNVNRWGNYQENNQTDIQTSTANTGAIGALSNGDFPYASQDSVAMKKAAYAWNLTKIQLPGGGTIQPAYEPHHYAYTQDQRAMEMFLIDGFGPSQANMARHTLYTPSVGYVPTQSNNFVKIKLNKPLPAGNSADQLHQLLYRYFNVTTVPAGGLPQFFYYKTLIQLRTGVGRETTWEWVNGYCQIVNAGVIDPLHAWIELKPVCINDEPDNSCNDAINPIAKNAFQFMRLNRSGLCYGSSEAQPLPDNVTLDDFLHTHGLSSAVSDQTQAFIHGFNKYARERNFANNVAMDMSFFRLYSPDQDKIIGGSRVKTVITSDDWDQLTAGYGTPQAAGKSYTTDYEYTDVIKDPVNNQDRVISSGVTEYEPPVGGDENPLHQPSFYNQQIKLAPDNNLYVELPYNEALFPAANLIYSKVKVTANKTSLPVPGTGYQVYRFFTAKDYPIKTDHTEIGDNFEKKTSMLQGLTSSILGIGQFHDYVTISQGFDIVRNDMHGKARSTQNYNSQGALVSAEEYEYALNKNLLLARRDGTVSTSNKLGVSISAICDARSTETNTTVVGVDLNLDFTILSVVPAFMFIPLPKTTIENTRLNSVAFNKIIDKKAIMVKKTVTENGSAVSTENLVFDEKTGNTVLTRTTNEFNDPVYTFHYPAHWIYSGLSAGYQSDGLAIPVSASNSVIIGNAQSFNALSKGDELVSVNGDRLWITAKSGSSVIVQPKIPGNPPATGIYTVLRPGRRNLINAEAGTVVTNYYPVRNNRFYFATNPDSTGIINASIQQYADNRVKPCDCDTIKRPTGSPVTTAAKNPYLTGELGNWYPLRSWAYLTGRTRSLGMTDNQTNLRRDGVFKTYNSFYVPPTNLYAAWQYNPTNWQWVEAVTIKDVNGTTLETTDPLDRHNSTLTGYQQKLIVAQADNARERELLFDGFEDWNYLAYASNCDNTAICVPERIKWSGIFNVTTDQAHTGKFSGQLMAPVGQVFVPLNSKAACAITTLPNNGDKRDVSAVPVREVTETAEDATISQVCCTGTFVPVKGKKYIVSAWVRETGNDLTYTFSAPSISVGNAVFNTSGNIIDGWQRITGEFSIPANASSISIKFGKGSNPTYFDDIRVYPADAKMTTYVYDRNTQKLTFTNDENNYFSKYNYDGENNLQSINKETEQGVLTIKESRSATHKN